jgi:hypothetical protein
MEGSSTIAMTEASLKDSEVPAAASLFGPTVAFPRTIDRSAFCVIRRLGGVCNKLGNQEGIC